MWMALAIDVIKYKPKNKTKYKVRNWAEYDASLKNRGNINVWFDEAAIETWDAEPSGLPGGQRRYSNLAIVTALTLRTVFHLPLRQTEGFLDSVFQLMGLDLDVPDHTTLSRRSGKLEVPEITKDHNGSIHLVIDSTGLKILGDGEWHALKHRTSNKRRSWRKLHLGVDGDGFIVTSKLTKSNDDDGVVALDLIEDIEPEIGRFTADGAYGSRAIYVALLARNHDTTIVVPPQKGAKVSNPTDPVLKQRDDAVRRIDEVERRQYKKESGAHQQARAENAMSRYKRIIGDSLRSRTGPTQETEARIGARILNIMTGLGRPVSEAIRT